MKKCPFCAEQVQDLAMKCKHCYSELPAVSASARKQESTSPFDSWIIKGLLLSIAAIFYFSILFFEPISAFLLALLAIWWLNVRDKRSLISRLRSFKQHKLRLVFSLAALGMSILASYTANYPTPFLEIVSDTGNQGQSTSYNLEVKTEDTEYLVVNGINITESNGGVFSTTVALESIETQIDIKAVNAVKTSHASVVIRRDQTEEEIAAAEVVKKREEAERRAWEATEAGQVCLRHPTWTKEDCQSVADGEIWIGMQIGMLREIRGAPNSANPSNYGSGVQWQWCWYNYNPMCFYDYNNDGLIDSYN